MKRKIMKTMDLMEIVDLEQIISGMNYHMENMVTIQNFLVNLLEINLFVLYPL